MSGILGAASSGSSISISTNLSFSITPAVSGKSTWDIAVDGPLNLGTTGSWTIVPNENATVKLTAWGAGGGGGGFPHSVGPSTAIASGTVVTSTTHGGAGGFAERTTTLMAGTPYLVRVGQGGARSVSASSGATHLAGGLPNGNGIQGGGYSGMFSSSVTQANALIVAAGGGGAPASNYAGAGPGGGGGGGTTGGQGSGGSLQGGSGGTQTGGGQASIYNGAGPGSALVGGAAAVTNPALGGGGGGYFGGGGGNVGGGGGGSSWAPGGTLLAANGPTPGNSGSALREGAGDVTPAGSAGAGNVARGNDGRFVLSI